VLSDLFWYWLSPGAEVHQEHLEPGERYDQVARATRSILALPRKSAEDLTIRAAARVLDELGRRTTHVRLRDLMMPIWAEFYYELVFAVPCPARARELIVANANDVVTALKCCGLRHMKRRDRLTTFLIEKLELGEVPHALPERLSTVERALYLQGVFFNTAVVQMSEAMTHLILLIAEHPVVQARLAEHPEADDYLERVITEALRLYPLFGISHRITSAPIDIDTDTRLPEGSVLCFNHPDFQRYGFEAPDRFDPDRWLRVSPRCANYIPFGVSGNRPCPAQALALIGLRVATRELLARFSVRSSVAHSRSIPNRGPCLMIPRSSARNRVREAATLVWMRTRDGWEDVGRSVTQLVLGTYMLWDARRLRLCARHFESLHGNVAS
jgi:cytochrome P450